MGDSCRDTAFTDFSISNTFGVHRPLVDIYYLPSSQAPSPGPGEPPVLHGVVFSLL